MPHICAVLSLATYRLAFPGAEEGPLFSGSSEYDRFRKILERTVTRHADAIRRLGIDPNGIGVHFAIRKGAATYCCNGTPTDVSFTAVYARAGWSLGNTKDRYLHSADAGGQVCGRSAARLDVNSHEFSASLPHFDFEGDDTEEDETKVDALIILTDFLWRQLYRNCRAMGAEQRR
jgi:hypothetical protein